mgnify:CR=1 FL=1
MKSEHSTDEIRANLATAATALRILPDAECAVDGLNVDAFELAEFLAEQSDPEWLKPAAMTRWAEIIAERGFEQIDAGVVAT